MGWITAKNPTWGTLVLTVTRKICLSGKNITPMSFFDFAHKVLYNLPVNEDCNHDDTTTPGESIAHQGTSDYMKWKNEYNIGVASIDNQHKKLTLTIGSLQNALSTTYVNQQMAQTLKFLVKYTQHHFSEEEDVMQAVGFPFLDQHREMHEKLVEEVKEILLRLKNKEEVNAGQLIDFLFHWLNDHILEEDRKIGVHIQNMKAKGNPVKPSSQASERKILTDRLSELVSLFDSKLICEEDHSSKKEYLVSDYLELQLIETKEAMDAAFEFLKSLLEQRLINLREFKQFQKQLADTVNLKQILDTAKDNAEKMETLNFLSEQQLISREKFGIFKEQLLDNI